MAAMKKLPADYAIDALAMEADRRRQLGHHQYSYGKLVAETTYEERQVLAEKYRKGELCRRAGEPQKTKRKKKAYEKD